MNTSKSSEHTAQRIAAILAVSASALGLTACDKAGEQSVGQRLDSAVEKTEQAADNARSKARDALQSAQNKLEQGAAQVESGARQAANSANTTRAAIDDATITAQVQAALAQDPDLSAIKIQVGTVDGKVTLDGPAPSTIARDRAETIAKAVTGVTAVNNQLVVVSG